MVSSLLLTSPTFCTSSCPLSACGLLDGVPAVRILLGGGERGERRMRDGIVDFVLGREHGAWGLQIEGVMPACVGIIGSR